MIVRLALTAGLVMGAAGLTSQIASAVPLAPQTNAISRAAAEASPIVQAQGGHCRRWRHECADRWGWRTPRFFVCMARHGCG